MLIFSSICEFFATPVINIYLYILIVYITSLLEGKGDKFYLNFV